MPAEAFADLWGVLKEGLPWRGVVKNRCKNGDYYWVDAFVAPVFKGMQVVGYISVRSRPSVSAIQAAELTYAGVRAGNAALMAKVSRWRRLTIKSRLMALTGCLVLAVVAAASLGLVGIRTANEALQIGFRNQTASCGKTAFNGGNGKVDFHERRLANWRRSKMMAPQRAPYKLRASGLPDSTLATEQQNRHYR